MAQFNVTIRTISEAKKHPGADRLFIYRLHGLGYQFISNVKYNVGDRVVYFPVDSVMPPRLIEAFELGNMLSGKQHDRVKTVRLRKEISQGFVADLNSVIPLIEDEEGTKDLIALLQLATKGKDVSEIDLAEVLGVTKYEPPPVPCQNGDLVPLPLGNSMYDIEGCDNFPQVVQWLIDQRIPVIITEKLEGQNFSVSTTAHGDEYVSQRRYSIREKEGGEHDMWEVARREKIIELANKIRNAGYGNDITLYGEHLGPGIQGNYYKLKQRTVRFFSLKFNGEWLGNEPFLETLQQFNALERSVPVIARNVLLDEWLDGRTVQQASNGKSLLSKERLREGIVICPSVELKDHPFTDVIGQHLIIKQRDPIYLDKTGH